MPRSLCFTSPITGTRDRIGGPVPSAGSKAVVGTAEASPAMGLLAPGLSRDERNPKRRQGQKVDVAQRLRTLSQRVVRKDLEA